LSLVNVYTTEQKYDVLQKIELFGNLREVSRQTSVPYDTLLSWKKQGWYHAMMSDIRSATRSEMSSKMSRIVDKALASVEDRLEKGDYVLNNKTGKITRKPVVLRDVARVASDLLGKQIKLEEINSKEARTDENITDTLEALKQEFAKFNKNKAEIIDIPFKEVPTT
jgi:hypothetical protein